MSTQTPAYVRVAAATATFTSVLLAGQTLSASFLVIPCILQSPAPLLAQQWATLYSIGSNVAIPSSLTASVIFGWLARREHAYTHAFKFYSFAAILMPSIVPYTLLVLRPTNAKLHERAAAATKAARAEGVQADKYQLGRGDGEPVPGETVHQLVDRWAWLNLGRVVISIAAGACAVWAAVGDL